MKKLIGIFVLAMTVTMAMAGSNDAANVDNYYQTVANQDNPAFFGQVPMGGQDIIILTNTTRQVFCMETIKSEKDTRKIIRRDITWRCRLTPEKPVKVMHNLHYEADVTYDIVGAGKFCVEGQYPALKFIRSVKD